MTGSPGLDKPCRSLAAVRDALHLDRAEWTERLLRSESAGNSGEIAFCTQKIAHIDRWLRTLDAEIERKSPIELRRERWLAMLSQLECEQSGCVFAATLYEREIGRIDERLRAIEAADSGDESMFDAGVLR